jgi:hypothetical protein
VTGLRFRSEAEWAVWSTAFGAATTADNSLQSATYRADQKILAMRSRSGETAEDGRLEALENQLVELKASLARLKQDISIIDRS